MIICERLAAPRVRLSDDALEGEVTKVKENVDAMDFYFTFMRYWQEFPSLRNVRKDIISNTVCSFTRNKYRK